MNTSVIPTGIRKIKDVLKEYSTWALALVLAAPELYNLAATAGMLADEAMPQPLMNVIRTVAAIGLVLKFVNQNRPEKGKL